MHLFFVIQRLISFTIIIFVPLTLFQMMNKPVFVISGEKNRGKTVFLQKITALLSSEKFLVRGFYALNDETTDSYYIIDLQTNTKILLMTRTGPPEIRPFHFQINETAIEAGTEWVCLEKQTEKSIVVLDEIGYYELKGMVWHRIFSEVLKSPSPVLFTTKTKHLQKIIETWKFQPDTIYYPSDFSNPGKAAKQISDAVELYFQNILTDKTEKS